MYQPTRLEDVITELKKRYGHQIIHSANQLEIDIKPINTGIRVLDSLLQGGLLLGYLNEIVGKPTSGATSLIHCITGYVQKHGREVVYIDLEQCFDPLHAITNDINLSQLLIVQPSEPNHALALVRDISIQNLPCLVILDAGNTSLGKQFNRLELRLAQSSTCVLALTTQSTQQSQVIVTLKRVAWLYTDKKITGYRVISELSKHPNLAIKQIEFDIHFEGGKDA